MPNKTVQFFDSQFNRQISLADFKLNAFEVRALDYIRGTVLDLGCGLGNLALEAGRRGHRVEAVDACSNAVERINAVAGLEKLEVFASRVDLGAWSIPKPYTTIVSIGLLMFLPRSRALALIEDIQQHVEPGGRAIINVLVEGTTFMDMFEPGHFYLFGEGELAERFRGWNILASIHESFDAPSGTRKEFNTVVAERSSLP